MTLLTFLFIVLFFIGLFFYAKGNDLTYTFSEGFTTDISKGPRCPNLLIQKGSKFYLYNSKLAPVPGVNPIEFDNLEDYSEFLDWQRSQNIRCPVLYLQETYDAQGNKVYKTRPSVNELQAGLPPSTTSNAHNEIIIESNLGTPDVAVYPNPTLLVDATRNDPPYNENSYPAHDQTDYYIGTTTPLDVMDIQAEQAPISPDPMNPNWGGSAYTQKLVDQDYYKDNYVIKADVKL
jgi:hypothetical protein